MLVCYSDVPLIIQKQHEMDSSHSCIFFTLFNNISYLNSIWRQHFPTGYFLIILMTIIFNIQNTCNNQTTIQEHAKKNNCFSSSMVALVSQGSDNLLSTQIIGAKGFLIECHKTNNTKVITLAIRKGHR